MATTWSDFKAKYRGAQTRAVRAVCGTGTEPATAGAADGIDLRGLTAVEAYVEIGSKAVGSIRLKKLRPGDTVTVNGHVFTAVGASVNPSAVNLEFNLGTDAPLGDYGSDCKGAANLAQAINDYANTNNIVEAWAASDEPIVFIQGLVLGVAANAYTLATSSARAVVSGATLAGGQAAGAIAANASLKAYLQDPDTGRWTPAPDLDIPVPAGGDAAALPPFEVGGRVTRLQLMPDAIGASCKVHLNGIARR